MTRWLIYIAICIVLTVFTGIGYESLGKYQSLQDFPPPGQLVDIGERRIQLDCRGSGKPTVIFESGLDVNGSLSWSLVHDAIAKTSRACAYSRAGIMWSDPPDAPQNSHSIANDLHTTLKNAGERGPFVLVGHSLGGPYIMTYTKYFGDDVAGLVFVDAAHPEQLLRHKALGIPEPRMPQNVVLFYKAGVALNWMGVVRAAAQFYPRSPKQPEYDDLAMKAYVSTSLAGLLQEERALEQTLAEAATFQNVGNRPLFVLTASQPFPPETLAALNWSPEQARQSQELFLQMHDEQTAWSTSSKHQQLADSGHYIQFDRPDAIIAAVQWVVDQVRTRGSANSLK